MRALVEVFLSVAERVLPERLPQCMTFVRVFAGQPWLPYQAAFPAGQGSKTGVMRLVATGASSMYARWQPRIFSCSLPQDCRCCYVCVKRQIDFRCKRSVYGLGPLPVQTSGIQMSEQNEELIVNQHGIGTRDTDALSLHPVLTRHQLVWLARDRSFLDRTFDV